MLSVSRVNDRVFGPYMGSQQEQVGLRRLAFFAFNTSKGSGTIGSIGDAVW